MFNVRCRQNGIEHRLTKMKHPWTNGQVERMSPAFFRRRLGRRSMLREVIASRGNCSG
jgi:hypothetical protein